MHLAHIKSCSMLCCSLVDTSVVGTRSARELAALGPGTMLCDGNAYIFTFLAAASEWRHRISPFVTVTYEVSLRSFPWPASSHPGSWIRLAEVWLEGRQS